VAKELLEEEEANEAANEAKQARKREKKQRQRERRKLGYAEAAAKRQSEQSGTQAALAQAALAHAAEVQAPVPAATEAAVPTTASETSTPTPGSSGSTAGKRHNGGISETRREKQRENRKLKGEQKRKLAEQELGEQIRRLEQLMDMGFPEEACRQVRGSSPIITIYGRITLESRSWKVRASSQPLEHHRVER
jgi:hypothetical protein